MKNVPEIRFKGFEEEWNSDLISNFSSSFSGGTPSAGVKEYYGGNIPFIRSGEINNDRTELCLTNKGLNNSSAKIIDKGTLLYALYGATSGEVSISKIKGAINQAILAIIPYRFMSSNFLSNFLRCKKNEIVNELLQGGQGNLSASLVKGIIVTFPKEKEQNDIVSFFSFLDELICNLSNYIKSLKQLKSACLISMFPQQGETVPRVRFKGFDGEWKKKKLNSFASRITRKNRKLETKLPVTISALNGIIEQTMFFNNIVASSNLSGYYLMKKGEFAYNKSYSCGFPFGAVKRMDRYEMGGLSNLYIVFKIENMVCDDYILYLFETSTWHKEVSMRASEGARNHGLLNIGAEDFLDIDIWVPNDKAEQHQIASYFRNLDIQISEQEKRLEKLKQIKAACLDKMFV